MNDISTASLTPGPCPLYPTLLMLWLFQDFQFSWQLTKIFFTCESDIFGDCLLLDPGGAFRFGQ